MHTVQAICCKLKLLNLNPSVSGALNHVLKPLNQPLNLLVKFDPGSAEPEAHCICWHRCALQICQDIRHPFCRGSQANSQPAFILQLKGTANWERRRKQRLRFVSDSVCGGNFKLVQVGSSQKNVERAMISLKLYVFKYIYILYDCTILYMCF